MGEIKLFTELLLEAFEITHGETAFTTVSETMAEWAWTLYIRRMSFISSHGATTYHLHLSEICRA